MSKFTLFQDLDASLTKQPEKKFQVYEIQSGIEVIKAAVPLQSTSQFEKMFEALDDINSYSVKKILDSIGGRLQD